MQVYEIKVPLPQNEASRLDALQRYDILDTSAEQAFDDLTLLAAQICSTPIAFLSFVDMDRQWFKSRVGLMMNEIPREAALCAYTILRPDLLIIRDTLLDERFMTITGKFRASPQIRCRTPLYRGVRRYGRLRC